MRKLTIAAAAFCLVTTVSAQEQDIESGAEVAERIRNGGWFEKSTWQRGADGALEMQSFADGGGAGAGVFVPLLGADLERGLIHGGLIGYLSMVCHGHSDLLSMTDAEFHFAALGIDGADASLRQFLAVPPPSFHGARGRAELLDRMLAVSVLVRRGARSATVELQSLAANDKLPAPLRERARQAVAALGGTAAALPRLRLDGKTLRLPAAFDGCVILDHARLPDLSWLTAMGRRLSALVTIAAMQGAGGGISPATNHEAQGMCDIVSELPFGLAVRFGNARLDHSLVVVSAKADPRMPVAITWEAVGAFEHERWQEAKASARAVANNPLLGGSLEVAADHLFATTDGSKGLARPAMVEKMQLLLDTGSAIRAIVPANSKLLLAMAAAAELPAAVGAELRVTFGDPAVIVLMVTARDDEDAEAIVSKGKQLLAAGKELVAASVPESLSQSNDVKDLLAAIFAARFHTKEATAFATVEIRGFTSEKLRKIAELLVAMVR